jgi:hypothetical protein
MSCLGTKKFLTERERLGIDTDVVTAYNRFDKNMGNTNYKLLTMNQKQKLQLKE